MDTYRFLNMVCNILIRLFARVEVTGKENIPAAGPVIVVSNHKSNWDPVILAGGISRRLYFMAKNELFGWPVAGWLIRNAKAIPVKRGASDRNALKMSLDVLRDGNVLLIFPEGTRNKTDEILLPFHNGAAYLAAKTGAVILPVALKNTSGITGSWKSVAAELKIGRPVHFNDVGRKPSSDLLDGKMTEIRESIKKMLE